VFATETVSYDGIDWFESERHLLYGSYFFLDIKRAEHRRKAYSFI